MEWTDDKVFRLISLYEDHPCMYDLGCNDYHNRYKRKTATDKVAKKLGTTDVEVGRKWRYLRSQFAEELKKVKRTKSGIGFDDSNRSKWKYFDALKFLSAHVNVSKVTISNIDTEQNDDATLTTVSDSTVVEHLQVDDVERSQAQAAVQFFREESTPTSPEAEDKCAGSGVEKTPNSKSGPPNKKMRSSNENTAGNALTDVMPNYLTARSEPMKSRHQVVLSSQKCAEDKDTCFAKLVEAEMRSFTIPSIKRWAEKVIMNAISDGKSREEEVIDGGVGSQMMYDYYGYGSYYHHQLPSYQYFQVQPPPPPPLPSSLAQRTSTADHSLP